MIRNLFSGGGDIKAILIQLMFLIPIFMISFTVHELSHGYMAYRLGDPTARNMGRLTLNPIKHIDPMGFLILLFFGFGWAKPVPVNPRYFKDYKKGMAITAAAGPVSNLLMALLGVIISHIIASSSVLVTSNAVMSFLGQLYTFFYYFISLNLSLAFFNLVPLPPLDGSRIIDLFLSPEASFNYAKISRYSFIILMLLLYTNILTKPLGFLVSWTKIGMDFIVGLVPFL